MSKTIDTLVTDIYNLFDGHTPKEGHVDAFAAQFAKMVGHRLGERHEGGTIRMSNAGKPDCALWYKVNMPDKEEGIDNKTRMKFMFGDMYEEFVMFLAEQAGHTITGLQDECELEGIKGHRDCVIDGMLVDVKSASPMTFEKFENGLMKYDKKANKWLDADDFNYKFQLGSYLEAAQDDPLVTVKDKAAFLVIQKVTGELHLCTFEFPVDGYHAKQIKRKKEMVKGPKPPRAYAPRPHGKSGNMELIPQCGYCSFKKTCWPELRTFMYKAGKGFRPVHLTTVKRLPDVLEVT